MNNNFEKIIKNAKNFSLKEEEKLSILQKISIFVEENPISSIAGLISTPYWEDIKEKKYGSRFLSSFRSFSSNKFAPVFVLLALVFIGGATSFAANYALPGDFLYPVKTEINEKLQGLATIGPAANAKLESDLALKRLDEAEKLATKGTITLQASDEIKKNFSAHADKAKALSATLEQKGDTTAAAEVDSNLQKGLEVHSQILGDIRAKDQKDEQGLDEVNATVKTYINAETDQSDTKPDTESNNDKKEERIRHSSLHLGS